MWVRQRAKAHWLTNFDDDLKYPYCSIDERKNSNQSLQLAQGLTSDPNAIAEEFCNFNPSLFNIGSLASLTIHGIPLGNTFSPNQVFDLEYDISNKKIISPLP